MQLITWKEFIEGTLLLAAIYYLVVISIYYRKELRILVSGQSAGEDLSGSIDIADLPEAREGPERKD